VRKRLRLLLILATAVLLVLAGLLGVLYWALRYVPPAYREAIESAPVQLREDNDALLQQASALSSDVQRRGTWEAVFTADEINGWLAVDLIENHPDTLPPMFQDPRVAINPGEITLFCRIRRWGVSSVVSLRLEPYVVEPNVVAARIHSPRAGRLPMPLGEILDRISQAASRLGVPLQWRQADGDPVVMATIPAPRNRGDRAMELEAIELRAGEVYIRGTTRREGRD